MVAVEQRGSLVVARWRVDPLHRSRRGLDEWLGLATPWLRPVFSRVFALRPGSRLRCAFITRTIRVGVAAQNRRDYEAVAATLSPDVELHVYPDAAELRYLDLEPVYHGHMGYIKGAEVLKAGFGRFHWELRELLDPGGNQFGARTERVGSGGHSGIEVRASEFHVWQIEHGLVRRQWVLASEAAMLTLFEGNRAVPDRMERFS